MTHQQFARLNVTLMSSENTYIQYPAEGLLVINEVGTNGSIISASFRLADGTKIGGLAPLVEVRNPVFTYGKPDEKP